MDIDYGRLPGASTWDKIRELIIFVIRNDRVPHLLSYLKKARPSVKWPSIRDFDSRDDIWNQGSVPPPFYRGSISLEEFRFNWREGCLARGLQIGLGLIFVAFVLVFAFVIVPAVVNPDPTPTRFIETPHPTISPMPERTPEPTREIIAVPTEEPMVAPTEEPLPAPSDEEPTEEPPATIVSVTPISSTRILLPRITVVGTATIVSVTPISSPPFGDSPLVLWDVTHGIYIEPSTQSTLDYNPVPNGGGYSRLLQVFQNRGYQVDVIDNNIQNVSLSDYSIVVLNLAWTRNTPYSESEVDQILAYARNGGNLIIISDQKIALTENIEPVTKPLGIEIGMGHIGSISAPGTLAPTPPTINPSDLLVIFSEHPVFSGIESLFIDYYSGELKVSFREGTVATAANRSGQVGAMAFTEQLGKVVILGDIAMWHDSEIFNRQNLLFANNVINWMSSQ